jgi:hypothetical protein
MKIIIIPHSVWTNIPTRAEYFINHLKNNHEVHLVTWTMPYPLKFETISKNVLKSREKFTQKVEKNLFVHHVSRQWIFPPFNNKSFKNQLKEIINEYNIDAIFSESFIFDFVPSFDDVPVFYDMVDDHLSFFKNAHISQKIIGRVGRVNKATTKQLKNSNKTFFVSSVLEEDYKNLCRESVVLPNGVDLKKYERTNVDKYIDKFNLNEYDVVLGYVGYFGEWSNLNNTVVNVNNFLKEQNGAIVIVGIGPEVDFLKKNYKDNDRLIFTGMVNSSEIPSITKTFDIGLLPFKKCKYTDAASPIKYFEYAAANIKVVSSNLEEVKRINLNNSFFFDKISDISIKLLEAMNSDFDQNKLNKSIKKFDWNILAKNLSNNLK